MHRLDNVALVRQADNALSGFVTHNTYDTGGQLLRTDSVESSRTDHIHDNATASTWQQLQTAVRVGQAGTVEVAVGTDAADWSASFDDLRLEQTGSLIVQEQHRYAYGAPLTGLSYVAWWAPSATATATRGSMPSRTRRRVGKALNCAFVIRSFCWMSYDPKGQFDSPYVGFELYKPL